MRSWIDTGFVQKLLDNNAELEIFVPREAVEIQKELASKQIAYSKVTLDKNLLQYFLGRFLWAASMRTSISLRSRRKQILFGFSQKKGHRGLKKNLIAIADALRVCLGFLLSQPGGWFLALTGPAFPAFVKRKLTLPVTYSKWEGVVFEKEICSSIFLVPTAGYEDWMASFLLRMKSRGIKTVLVPDNWDNLTSKNFLPVEPDRIVVMGPESAKNISRELAIPPYKFWPTGLPKFSSIEQNPGRAKRELSDEVRILFLGFSFPYLEILTLNKLNELLQRNSSRNWLVSYKPHPNRRIGPFKDQELSFGIEEITSVSKYELPEIGRGYLEFLKKFDFVIGPPTTMILEFCLSGYSRVILDLSDDLHYNSTPSMFAKNWTHVADLEPMNLSIARTPEEMVELIEVSLEIRDDPDISKVLAPNPNKYHKELLAKLQDELA